MQQRILILGAGISGLSLAWYLKKHPNAKITILEKSGRAGGWIETDHTTGFHFEKGPRAFMAKKGLSTLRLACDLGLASEVVWTEAKDLDRYLWFQERLHRFPRGPWGFVFSPLTRGLIPGLLTEVFRSGRSGDESVWDFAARRFGKEAADRLFGPLVVGIFGGDARQISIRSCFPVLKQWEEAHGSVTRGVWNTLRTKRDGGRFCEQIPAMPLSAFYSFSQGMHTLIDALVRQVPAEIVYEIEARSVSYDGAVWKVETGRGVWEADVLYAALPAAVTARLFRPLVPDLAEVLEGIVSLGFTLVSLGYDRNVLPVKGFGYLTPLGSAAGVLGTVFDSSVFPQHNQSSQETRMTVKFSDREEGEMDKRALAAVSDHLKVDATPDVIQVTRIADAIPQYGPFHLDKMAALQEAVKRRLPQCFFVGNYLAGVAVDQCIALAKRVAEESLS